MVFDAWDEHGGPGTYVGKECLVCALSARINQKHGGLQRGVRVGATAVGGHAAA